MQIKKVKQLSGFLIILSCIMNQACQSDTDRIGSEADLIRADIQFSDLSVKEGMKKAFLEFADDSVVLIRPNAWPIVGRESLGQSLLQLNDSVFTLSWEPLNAYMAKAGDMGYTYGIFTMKIKENGQENKGCYVSIWKRQSDGGWKYVLDCGNEGLGE